MISYTNATHFYLQKNLFDILQTIFVIICFDLKGIQLKNNILFQKGVWYASIASTFLPIEKKYRGYIFNSLSILLCMVSFCY